MPGKLGEGTSSVSELLFRLDNPDRLHSSRLEEGMGGLCLLGFDEPDQEKEWRLFFFFNHNVGEASAQAGLSVPATAKDSEGRCESKITMYLFYCFLCVV